MSNVSKKMLMAAAGSAGGAGLDVDEVFSTFLYDGTGSNLEINNGIDLTEGGMVWLKKRDSAKDHYLFDTARGVYKYIRSNVTDAEGSLNTTLTAFNSNGFSLGNRAAINDSGGDYVSWTFRNSPMFQVVTYTGNGTGNRTISHNLGSDVGMMLIKQTSDLYVANWIVYHRGIGATNYLELDNDSQANDYHFFEDTTPTSTQFTIHSNSKVNQNGESYVAYVFAHHANDGSATGFGPDGDSPVISCGSYTGNGSATGPVVNLGFEPQWLMIKCTSAGGQSWTILDNMRGLHTNSPPRLAPNLSQSEHYHSDYNVQLNADGFTIKGNAGATNDNNETYIYMAIRRGPLAAPDDATKVFSVQTKTNDPTAYDSGFPVDMALRRNSRTGTDDTQIGTRLLGTSKGYVNTTAVFDTNHPEFRWDFMGGWNSNASLTTNSISWMWKRAPGYFDVVAMTATSSSSSHTVNHNLTVPPEMVWIKRRDSTSSWTVYHNDGSTERTLYLETTLQGFSNSTLSSVGATSFVVNGGVLNASATYIMYLFASSNVSKVGSYTGNSSDGKQIDCGFSNGARFVLLKNTTVSNTNWLLFDTVRGIVAGNDARLYLNSSDSEHSSTDYIDPYSSGFALTANAQVNYSGSTYIFYAIA